MDKFRELSVAYWAERVSAEAALVPHNRLKSMSVLLSAATLVADDGVVEKFVEDCIYSSTALLIDSMKKFPVDSFDDVAKLVNCHSIIARYADSNGVQAALPANSTVPRANSTVPPATPTVPPATPAVPPATPTVPPATPTVPPTHKVVRPPTGRKRIIVESSDRPTTDDDYSPSDDDTDDDTIDIASDTTSDDTSDVGTRAPCINCGGGARTAVLKRTFVKYYMSHLNPNYVYERGDSVCHLCYKKAYSVVGSLKKRGRR